MCFIFLRWGISAITQGPHSEGPNAWCNTVGKFLNSFEQGPMFSLTLGPTNSVVILDGNIPVISSMHIRKMMFLETLIEQTSKIALVF